MNKKQYAINLTKREGLKKSTDVAQTQELMGLVYDDCEANPWEMLLLLFPRMDLTIVSHGQGVVHYELHPKPRAKKRKGKK